MAIIFGLIILSSTAWAQVLPCPSNFQNPPSVSQLSHSRTNDIIIPVVFHVVELDGLQLFSDAEIAQLMLVLNDDFELTSEERKSVITSVNGTPGSVGFHFALAEVDPSGAATSGILRIATDITNIGDKISGDGILVMKSSEMGGSDPWDVTNYVNVWIGERNISLGATVAANDDRSDIEGIIIGNRAMLESPKTISHENGALFWLTTSVGEFHRL